MTDDTRSTGWHPDPANPSVERWWNGISWGEQSRPVSGAKPIPTVPMSTPTPVDPYAQTVPPPPPPYSTATPPTRPTATRDGQFRALNPIGYAGVVLGFISILFNFFCIPSVLAIIFSSIGLNNAHRIRLSGGRAVGWNWCIAGVVLGVAETAFYLANTFR